MSRTFTDVWKEAAELSEQDRAALAGLLIESLEGEPDAEVEAAWASEINRRGAGSAAVDRRHHLDRFPFTIYYRVGADAITVVAVAHQKRRPGYWSSR